MATIPTDYSDQIKAVRGKLGLTQERLAAQLGVSFATVNRWEKGRSRPSQLAWGRLQGLLVQPSQPAETRSETRNTEEIPLDFTANPEAVRVIAEGERLSFGHLANPVFGTEVARIHPLPHQRIAVYDQILKQTRLRFLLADDAGAGKTIMTGLYIRERFARRLLKRVLIVPPAGLVGNWRRELATLFGLTFRIVSGSDARLGNPFVGEDSDRVIISLDTLAGVRLFSHLQEPEVLPYDLVVFDEAHKLSANRGADLYVRKTDRYKLAEALAGVKGLEPRWTLSWSASHLLLLTATPHMGKDYPYYALWRLLEPDILSTYEAFSAFPPVRRHPYFIRRTKEEMVYLDGQRLYPTRISDTLGYELSQGEISEQRLYDETTEYLRYVYNRAKLLNRSAARLAMSVFQRRLASSTFALLRSFERRLERLDGLIEQIQSGRLTMEQLITMQRRMREDEDIFESKTADDEVSEGEDEENERAEEHLLQGIVAASLADILAEKDQVMQLHKLTTQVHAMGTESKFERLREAMTDPRFADEKLIIFTEHRDTLAFLIRRLNGLGYTDQVVQIHGGMPYTEREEQVEQFRKSVRQGGARFLVCTDAAGEGINLQFCWLMVNYDIPWNPARLEQRMGRIHRYGQQHDPVIILNLVAAKTREGRVLYTLLDKLERIRQELQSDKVFDIIGRMFEGVSIRQYMEMAITEEQADAVACELDGRLTKHQVAALLDRERKLYGTGGDVVQQLPRLREDLEREAYRRLLPGYVRQYVEHAAPLVDLAIDGDPGGCFTLRPLQPGAADALLRLLETYPESLRGGLSFLRIQEQSDGLWLHPGEPLFESFRRLVVDRLGTQARQGAMFIDPTAEKPYLFHLAMVLVVRESHPDFDELAQKEVLECRLVGVKQYEGAELLVCPVEHLLLLKGGRGLPGVAQRLAITAKDHVARARAFLLERVGRTLAIERQKTLRTTIPEREDFLQRGFDYQETELAAARVRQAEKARAGNRAAQAELARIKQRQKTLVQSRQQAIAVLHRELELIAPHDVTLIAHALVVPSHDPEEQVKHEVQTEEIAMALAWAYEESAGAVVQDVHTPELARLAGLSDHPGFDLLSIRPDGEKRAIEVKGRTGVGEVEISANEWARACNMRDHYWLYAVFDCATPNPRLARVRDPFGALLAKAKGSVVINPRHIIDASDGGGFR
ncbi:RNA polymerase-associated protein RapA [Candidatus Entotheonellaceae bacterium PAL068K]